MKRIEDLPRRIRLISTGEVYEFRMFVRKPSGNLGIGYVKLGDSRARIVNTAVAPNYPITESSTIHTVSIMPTVQDAVNETHEKIECFVRQGLIECIPNT